MSTWRWTAAAAVGLMACAAAPAPRAERAPVAARPRVDAAREALEAALFAARPDHELRVAHWGEYTALVADGRVYASNGDDDLSAMIGAGLYGVLAARGEPAQLRCASIGVGSGVEVATLAGLGCGRVDVFERRAALFETARALTEWHDVRLHPGEAQAPFRVLTDAPEDGAPYDVIVQTPATTLLDRPFRLFTTERFAALSQLLSEDGVLVQHVQLYAIDADSHRRLLRTLAEAFEHLYVLTSDSLSADTLVIASRRPIGLDLAQLARWRADDSTWRFVFTANLDSNYAPIARAVFSSRDDVMRYVGDARPFTAADPMPEARLPLPPPGAPPGQADAEFEEAWTAAYEDFIASFGPSVGLAVHSHGWAFGGACLEALDECPAALYSEDTAPPIEWIFGLIEANRFRQAGIAIRYLANRGADVRVAAQTLLLVTDPRRAMPAFDPLDPFPTAPAHQAAVDRARAAWLARTEDPISALREVRSVAEQIGDTFALRIARAMLTLRMTPEAAGDLHDELQEMALLTEGHDWLESHPDGWCYVGWVASERRARAATVRSMRRCAEGRFAP